MSRASFDAICRKQSWADLSDEEDEFPMLPNSKGVTTLDAMSVTTGTGSPLMPWADVEEDCSDLSDWDPKAAGLEAAEPQGPRKKTGQSPERSMTDQGPARSQKKPPSPTQQRQANAKQRAALARPAVGAVADTPWAEEEQAAIVQPFSVQVEGIPAQLCNDCCLDAILHQAGLQDFVLSYDIADGGKGGITTIWLANWQAATQCYSHFSQQSWNLGKSVRVKMAPVANGQRQGRSDPPSSPQQQWHQQRAGPCEMPRKHKMPLRQSPESALSQSRPQKPQQPQQRGPQAPQHPMAMGCGMMFPQAGVPQGVCSVAWVPAAFAAEASDYAPQPFFVGQQMVLQLQA